MLRKKNVGKVGVSSKYRLFVGREERSSLMEKGRDIGGRPTR
jgi:hypothetical protein